MNTDDLPYILFIAVIIITVITILLLNFVGAFIAFDIYITGNLDPDHLEWWQWLSLASFSDIAFLGAIFMKDGE